MNTAIDRVLDEFDKSENEADVLDHFRRFAADRGFPFYAYLGVHGDGSDRPVPFMMTNYPRDWLRRYMDKGYADCDPVLRHALHASVPFTWGLKRQRQDYDAAGLQVFEESSEYGVRCGYSVPMLSSTNEFALMHVATPVDDDEFLSNYNKHRHEIHVVAVHFNDILRKRHDAYRANSDVFKLTRRELECLQWTAQGKTSWEIAHILDISENTLNFHLKNATKKLGVSRRHQAVIRALMLGLLRPETLQSSPNSTAMAILSETYQK